MQLFEMDIVIFPIYRVDDVAFPTKLPLTIGKCDFFHIISFSGRTVADIRLIAKRNIVDTMKHISSK